MASTFRTAVATLVSAGLVAGAMPATSAVAGEWRSGDRSWERRDDRFAGNGYGDRRNWRDDRRDGRDYRDYRGGPRNDYRDHADRRDKSDKKLARKLAIGLGALLIGTIIASEAGRRH